MPASSRHLDVGAARLCGNSVDVHRIERTPCQVARLLKQLAMLLPSIYLGRPDDHTGRRRLQAEVRPVFCDGLMKTASVG